MIPSVLFHSKNHQLFQNIQERISKLMKYQKNRFNAIKDTKLAIKTHYRIQDSNILNYIAKKVPSELVALAILLEDFNQGYAKVKVVKCFQGYSIENITKCDPKLCVALSEEAWARLIS